MAPQEPRDVPRGSGGRLRGRPAAGGFEQSYVTLRSQIDRMIDDFVRDFAPQLGWRTRGHNPFGRIDVEIGGAGLAAPHADLVEAAGRYEITVELPGLEASDVKVSLVDDQIIVSGNKDEGELEAVRIHMRERRFGPFRRSFRIPADVEVDALSASFDRGLLTIVLPKAASIETPPKQIDIRAG